MARLSSPLQGEAVRAALVEPMAAWDSSPCVEGSAFDANEGGGWNATGLARQLRPWAAHDKRAKSDGVPGGGEACGVRARHPHPGSSPGQALDAPNMS